MNFGQTGQNVDELISKVPLDLSGVTGNITMSFRYSYRKRYASTFEKLQLQVTNNCGESWSPRKTLQGDLLSSIAQNSSWSPSSIDDWTTVHVTNITSQYFVDNFRYKFRFEGESGNNFYLDNINVYYGDPSELLDITDIQNNVSGLSIYPNPTDDELNVSFNVSTSQISTMSITDVTGKQVYTTDIQAAPGSNLVMMETTGFAPGMYFLNVQVGSAQQTLQFIVK
jgi:hypothetical protein